MMAWVLFGLFFVLLFLGIPISVSLGLSAIASMALYGFPVAMFPLVMYASLGKFTLLAIPFFVLAGVIMEYAGISKRLIRFANVLVGHVPGGLAIVTVFVACFFAAISGSGPATVAAIGTILIPAMVDGGYERGFSCALIAASGNIGIIIPPSIAFVVFGVLAEVSIGRLFIAGIVPGLLIGAALIIVSLYLVKSRGMKLKTNPRSSWRERFDALKEAVWGLLAPVFILGGIYGGFVTPTEAAGVAVVYGLFVGLFIYREIRLRDIRKILIDASVSSAVVMFIIAFASVFAWLLTTGRIATSMAESMMAISSNKYVLLVIMNIVLLIAGCFVDAASAYYIFVPIMLPVIRQIGVDPIVFGVFMTVNLAIGMITPPVGLDIFMASNVGGISLKEVSVKVIPFLLASIVALIAITFVPALSLWLPDLIGIR